MLMAGCSDDSTTEEIPAAPDPDPEAYFTVPSNPITFTNKPEDAAVVSVSSSEAWEVAVAEEWLSAEVLANNSGFTLTAADNNTVFERNATVTVTSGEREATIEVTQSGGTAKIVSIIPYGDESFLPALGISESGNYVVGNRAGSSFRCEVNSQIDKTSLVMDPQFIGYVARSISNDGRISDWGITPNGRLLTGMEYVNNDIRNGFQGAFIVKDGVKKYLSYPKKDVNGTANYQGNVPLRITTDGKFILCRNVQGMSGVWCEAYWTLNETTGEYDFHFWDTDQVINVGGVDGYAEPVGVSHKGNYTCGVYVGMGGTQYPYFRNVETGKITILSDYVGHSATCITDNGMLFIVDEVGGDITSRTALVYDTKTGTATAFDKWCIENYGLAENTFKKLEQSQTVTAITPDMKRIVWYAALSTNTFINYMLTVE